MTRADHDTAKSSDLSPGANGTHASNGRTRPVRVRAAEALAALAAEDLPELYRFWSGEPSPHTPADPEVARADVARWMADEVQVEARLAGLGKQLLSILDHHLDAPRFQCNLLDLINARSLSYLSSYDLEANLNTLRRNALLVDAHSVGMEDYGERATAVPADLGDTILRRRRLHRRGVFDVFTLRGHLDRLYEDPARAARTPPSRQRELYKLYSSDAAAVARLERLPPELRPVVEKAVMEFGGILPRAMYERMDHALAWDGRRWGHLLEESLVGSVERLDLSRYGIQHNDETLLVFNEVALAYLKRVAVPGDPDRPHEESSLGVDLVSNISRFIGFVIDHHVRFTVHGEIFKTTEKRLQEELIVNPGRELTRSAVLEFIRGFAAHAHLIESTGERTFAMTAAGRDWEGHELETKLHALLEYAIDERSAAGEHHHQVRMRRILMRLFKRIEPGVWYDLMYGPFLARNTYLCSLDELEIEGHFAQRMQSGHYTPLEDVQRLGWNLVHWVRQRLYLLGIVDLGYDRAGRPVALRLTRVGARLLGVVDGAPEGAPRLGTLVVTPDFEVVLFPTGDDGELVHDLDRFCARSGGSGVMHFKIAERSLQRALAEGMHLKRIVSTLEAHSRTPVPQNVLYSIKSWAAQAGLMHLGADGRVQSEDPELVRRFAADPGVRPLLPKLIAPNTVRLEFNGTPRRLQSLLRDLGYLIELDE